MSEKCPRITDPSQCHRCLGLAQELLARGELTEEERTKVKEILHLLREKSAIEEESRIFLNDLAVRYLD